MLSQSCFIFIFHKGKKRFSKATVQRSKVLAPKREIQAADSIFTQHQVHAKKSERVSWYPTSLFGWEQPGLPLESPSHPGLQYAVECIILKQVTYTCQNSPTEFQFSGTSLPAVQVANVPGRNIRLATGKLIIIQLLASRPSQKEFSGKQNLV